MTVDSHAGQALLFVAYLALVGASALAFEPRGIVLPNPWFYLAFWAVPCLIVFLGIRLSRRGAAPLRVAIGLGALALGLAALGGEMRLLAAYTSSLGDVPSRGMLNNFYVTAHHAFNAPLLAGVLGALVLAVIGSVGRRSDAPN
jgi:hypothetical protein